MHYIKVFIGVLFGVAVFLFLDYALPSKNTVRITNTYNRLTLVTPRNAIFYASEDTGTIENPSGQRDVRFIDTVRPNGKVFVYRNEDTGWVWPPYFKYDSANLHSEATNLRSASGSPQWVSITAYGWRLPWLSIYPNAIGIDTLASPSEQPRNWPAMVILGVLFLFLLSLWRLWTQFRKRRIDPAIRAVDDRWDDATDRVSSETAEMRGSFRRFRDRLFGKSHR